MSTQNFNFTESGYEPGSGSFNFGVYPATGDEYEASKSTELLFDFTEQSYTAPDSTEIEFNFVPLVVPDYTVYVLAGTSTDYTSIWADPTANINTARMYVGSRGTGAAFSVVDLPTKTLVDSYLIDTAGEYDEMLDSEDIIDINVSTVGA